MDDKEKLLLLENRIKELSLDKDNLLETVILDIGEENYYSGNFQHELMETINDARLKINALMTERRHLRESLGYDIIREEEK